MNESGSSSTFADALSLLSHTKFSGGHTGGVTPDPIPNSEVKASWADGTAGDTLWESKSPPELFFVEQPYTIV